MITRFLKQLFEHGRVNAELPENDTEVDMSELHELLEQFNFIYRQQLPAGLPKFDLQAAVYGAITIYRACQLLIYRDYSEEDIRRGIAIGTMSSDPAEHVGADLVLRFLPDVVRLARAAAPADPLVNRLLELGRAWPLSSVGITELGNIDITPLTEDPAVFQLYVDRILSKADRSRITDGRVREAIDAAVGAFPELAGSLSRKNP